MTNGAEIDLDCNLNIKCYNQNNQLVRDSNIHNKATVGMVNGILRFLRGDFNPTSKNPNQNLNEGKVYIPTHANFGWVGVEFNTENSVQYFKEISGNQSFPQFSDTSLQRPIDITPQIFERIRVVRHPDNNNAESLELSLSIRPGELVGYTNHTDDPINEVFHPYQWAYKNPNNNNNYEAMLTEIGLLSDTGTLLARVLLDGEVTTGYIEENTTDPSKAYPIFTDPENTHNPIIQTNSTTIVLIWKIGIVSIGENDQFITQNTTS